MKKHCMLDIETLSQDPKAAVISIGAVIFNNTGIKHSMKVNIKPESAKAFGMVISEDTVDWWLKQSPEARAAALEKNVRADFGLGEFVKWIKLHNPDYVWAHGVTFDIVILEHAFKCVSLDCPWKYWQIMDCRTVLNMFGVNTKDLHATANSTHHDAVDDARIQAEALIAILNAMDWGNEDGPLKI